MIDLHAIGKVMTNFIFFKKTGLWIQKGILVAVGLNY